MTTALHGPFPAMYPQPGRNHTGMWHLHVNQHQEPSIKTAGKCPWCYHEVVQ